MASSLLKKQPALVVASIAKRYGLKFGGGENNCSPTPAIRNMTTSSLKLTRDSPYNQYFTQQSDAIEGRTVEFSSSRSRDVSGATILSQQEQWKNEPSTNNSANHENDFDKSWQKENENQDRPHVDSYDSRGSISLSSVMQSQVPEPYSTYGKRAPTHLNMPGGSNSQEQKYLSNHLQNTHYSHGDKPRQIHSSAWQTRNVEVD